MESTAASASTVTDIAIIISANVPFFPLGCVHGNPPDCTITGRLMQLNSDLSSCVTTTSPGPGLIGTH